MDRRLLGWMLSIAHFFIAVLVLAVLVGIGWGALAFVTTYRTAAGVPAVRNLTWALFAGVVVLMLLWYLPLLLVPMLQIRRAMREAMEGNYADASARLRRLRDREVVLRLLGVPGAVWSQARVGEAYAYYLHGMTEEALAGALEVAREWRSSPARTAAVVAASAAANLGDRAAFEVLAPQLRRAESHPAKPASQHLLGAQGIAWAMHLELDAAARRAEVLIAADPSSLHRMGRLLRAQVRSMRGDFAGAEEDLAVVLALPSLATGKPAAVFMRQAVQAAHAELRRAAGDVNGAADIAAAIATEGPRHRIPRVVSISLPGLAAAQRGDAAGARDAMAALDGVELQWVFDPLLRAHAALARARILLALGDPAGALQGLGPAISSPLAVFRLAGLWEQGLALTAAGDAAGAAESFGWCAALCPESRLAMLARERVTSPPVAT